MSLLRKVSSFAATAFVAAAPLCVGFYSASLAQATTTPTPTTSSSAKQATNLDDWAKQHCPNGDQLENHSLGNTPIYLGYSTEKKSTYLGMAQSTKFNDTGIFIDPSKVQSKDKLAACVRVKSKQEATPINAEIFYGALFKSDPQASTLLWKTSKIRKTYTTTFEVTKASFYTNTASLSIQSKDIEAGTLATPYAFPAIKSQEEYSQSFSFSEAGFYTLSIKATTTNKYMPSNQYVSYLDYTFIVGKEAVIPSQIEDAVRPTTDPTTDPSTKPSTDPSTDPSTKPSTDPSTNPSSDPTSNPSTDPSTKPSTGSTDKPATPGNPDNPTGTRDPSNPSPGTDSPAPSSEPTSPQHPSSNPGGSTNPGTDSHPTAPRNPGEGVLPSQSGQNSGNRNLVSSTSASSARLQGQNGRQSTGTDLIAALYPQSRLGASVPNHSKGFPLSPGYAPSGSDSSSSSSSQEATDSQAPDASSADNNSSISSLINPPKFHAASGSTDAAVKQWISSSSLAVFVLGLGSAGFFGVGLVIYSRLHP